MTPWPLKWTPKQRTRWPDRFANAATADESMPPLKNAPTGTSDMSCSCTTLPSSRRRSHTLSVTLSWRGRKPSVSA